MSGWGGLIRFFWMDAICSGSLRAPLFFFSPLLCFIHIIFHHSCCALIYSSYCFCCWSLYKRPHFCHNILLLFFFVHFCLVLFLIFALVFNFRNIITVSYFEDWISILLRMNFFVLFFFIHVIIYRCASVCFSFFLLLKKIHYCCYEGVCKT